MSNQTIVLLGFTALPVIVLVVVIYFLFPSGNLLTRTRLGWVRRLYIRHNQRNPDPLWVSALFRNRYVSAAEIQEVLKISDRIFFGVILQSVEEIIASYPGTPEPVLVNLGDKVNEFGSPVSKIARVALVAYPNVSEDIRTRWALEWGVC